MNQWSLASKCRSWDIRERISVSDVSSNLFFCAPFGLRSLSMVVLVGGLLQASAVQAQIITTVAGSGARGFSGDGGPALSASLDYPTGLALDAAGNLYIADGNNNRVRKVAPDGLISTVAGSGTCTLDSPDGGQAISTNLCGTVAVAVDAGGNLYIADSGHHRIRKVTPDGVISTVAGNGVPGFSGDGGPAVNASLHTPEGVAVDSSGNLYISDYAWNLRIRKVTLDGVINTVAGNGTQGYSGDGGPATSASLQGSNYGIAVDASGNLYIADPPRVRKVTPGGVISTVAGGGVTGYLGDGGPATSAWLDYDYYVAVDAGGNLYISEQGSHIRIRRVTLDGVITTIAGNGTMGFSGDGGPATSASLSNPRAITFDAAGNLYIADSANQRVRKVTNVGLPPPPPPPPTAQIGIDPASIDFAGQVLGTSSTSRSVTITNAGTAALAIYGVSLSGSNAGDFAIDYTNCNGASLAPNAWCVVSTVFRPTALGTRTAAISIADSASGSPHSATLTGSGLAVPPPPAPSISNLQTPSGPAGTVVTIVGSNFGSSQGASVVLFGSNPATIITSWKDSQIKATAPANGSLTGPVPLKVQMGAQTSNEVTFTYTTATKIENKCDASLLSQYFYFYKSTCDLITVLRSADGFRISSSDASTDALFNWLRTGNNEDAIWALVGNVQLGQAVDRFIHYQSSTWDYKAAGSFVDSIKKAGSTAKTILQPIAKLVTIGSESVAIAFALRFVSTLDAIQSGFKVYNAFAVTLSTQASRDLLWQYTQNRATMTVEGAKQEYKLYESERMNLVICLNKVALCTTGLAPTWAVESYLDWLEIQYQAYRLAVTPAAREAYGKAIAQTATGN